MNDEMHKKINEVNELFQRLSKERPDLMEPFGELVNQSLKDGKLDTKTKEIIMVILALATGCEWCLPYHIDLALKSGATRDELIEASFLALLMTGTPSLMRLIDLLNYLKG
jgi:alkylhydroperoxidase AhpD family core domain